MNSHPETLQQAAANPTIANNLELAYEYYFSVCDSLSVSAMPAAQFAEQWKARHHTSPSIQQPKVTAADPSVSIQRNGTDMVVNIRSGGRDLSVRTVNGTASELRSIAYEMEQDGLRRLRRAALVLAGASALDPAAHAE